MARAPSITICPLLESQKRVEPPPAVGTDEGLDQIKQTYG
jgi:hypothetical protein